MDLVDDAGRRGDEIEIELALKTLLDTLSAEPALMLVAARYDGGLFSPEGIRSLLTTLPPKTALQSELVSVLQPIPYVLASTLESAAARLVLTLDRRLTQMAPAAGSEPSPVPAPEASP